MPILNFRYPGKMIFKKIVDILTSKRFLKPLDLICPYNRVLMAKHLILAKQQPTSVDLAMG